MLKTFVDQNPLVWMAEVNGLLVDYAKCLVRCKRSPREGLDALHSGRPIAAGADLSQPAIYKDQPQPLEEAGGNRVRLRRSGDDRGSAPAFSLRANRAYIEWCRQTAAQASRLHSLLKGLKLSDDLLRKDSAVQLPRNAEATDRSGLEHDMDDPAIRAQSWMGLYRHRRDALE